MKNSRRAAYDALNAVTRDGAYTSLALKNNIPSDMTGDDRKFASLLTRSTLENLLKLDYVLDKFIKSARVHGSIRNILRLGACQMIILDTEPYAAVSESVALAKRIKPQAAGFVNAVLRSIAREKDSIEYPIGKDAKTLSVLYSYPVWICEKFISDFGFDFTEKMLSYRSPDGTQVRMNTLKVDKESFLAQVKSNDLSYKEGAIEDSYVIEGLSDIENMELYKSGWIAVQSQSAMRAVKETGIKQGMKLLDCCAAPGGKSAYAAALTVNTLDITAWDVHPHRADMMRKNLTRLGLERAEVEVRDASEYHSEYKDTYDTVIIDAPCSAMGLMCKSPDIRYSRKPEDIISLNETQKKILSSCSGYVKPGGTLAYYTCSINKEENEDITDDFLEKNKNFEYAKEPVTLYPHLCGSDGFYIAVMKRAR